jgi:hypothetical protein
VRLDTRAGRGTDGRTDGAAAETRRDGGGAELALASLEKKRGKREDFHVSSAKPLTPTMPAVAAHASL